MVLQDAAGSRFVRLENLDISNGPDLFVYLSTNPPDGPEGRFDDDYVNLGRLQGNVGSSNYLIPAGTDLSRYTSVVIWCDRFNSAFGAAPLFSDLDLSWVSAPTPGSSTPSWDAELWKCSMYPKLIVPLQIDLAIGSRRYRFSVEDVRSWRATSCSAVVGDRGTPSTTPCPNDASAPSPVPTL